MGVRGSTVRDDVGIVPYGGIQEVRASVVRRDEGAVERSGTSTLGVHSPIRNVTRGAYICCAGGVEPRPYDFSRSVCVYRTGRCGHRPLRRDTRGACVCCAGGQSRPPLRRGTRGAYRRAGQSPAHTISQGVHAFAADTAARIMAAGRGVLPRPANASSDILRGREGVTPPLPPSAWHGR